MDLGKQQPQVFDPGDRRHRWKLWVRLVATDTTYLHVFWRRVAAVLCVLAVLAWLGLAGAAWGFVKYRRGYADVSYLDLAFYPLRREHYRTGLGQHYLKLGRVAFARKDYREGYVYLQAGLARVPEDSAARRCVAIAEVRFGRPDRALRTLTAGLPYAGEDLAYVKLLFGLLLETHDDEQLIALATGFLPARPNPVLAHQFAALQTATAHYHRGRTEQAERLIADWKLESSLEGQLLLAQCDWDRGQCESALLRLEQQVAVFPQRDELYLELVRLHREAGHLDEARRYALLRQFNNPASPGPRIDLLHGYRTAGDRAALARELEAYLASFSRDAQALLLLADFAVDTRQPELAARVRDLAYTALLPLQLFDLARVQVAIAVRDYRTACDLAETALRSDYSGQEYAAALLDAQHAVALFGLGEQTHAQGILASFLNTPRMRANDALLLARQLGALNQRTQARRVLARAVQIDPRNQPALTELIRFDAESGDRNAVVQNLPALLAMRKPSRPALEDVLCHLNEPGDAALRAQIRMALDGSAQAQKPPKTAPPVISQSGISHL